jgi:hypothetical protein
MKSAVAKLEMSGKEDEGSDNTRKSIEKGPEGSEST